jgi:hypothetical protein
VSEERTVKGAEDDGPVRILANTPACLLLGGLWSVIEDLKRAEEHAEVSLSAWSKEAPHSVRNYSVFTSHSTAAVVFYARPFKKDRRNRARKLLEAAVATLGSDDQETHAEILRIRDKHIGHHVDGDESFKVIAIATKEGGRWEVSEPHVEWSFKLGLQRSLARQLRALAGRMRRALQVDTRLVREKAKAELQALTELERSWT